ncbi:MAG: response regulator transcription factor [Elusimicrobia bacterium]|nr:response regulator transcription factor [Elusimicrobiota bacterium]
MTSKPSKKIALVDDDESIQDYLKTFFDLHGYTVYAYSTPGRFLDSLLKIKPDFILLDIHLPNISGWDLLKTLRGNNQLKTVPIVLLTAKYKKTVDLVQGFELGADDFITMPSDPEVILARVEAVLRRYQWQRGEEDSERVYFEALTLSPTEHLVQLNGKELKLTHLEFDLLLYLLKNPNRVHTRAILLEKVWKETAELSSRTVDKHIESLRKKLGSLGSRIQTIVGVGYQLKDSS